MKRETEAPQHGLKQVEDNDGQDAIPFAPARGSPAELTGNRAFPTREPEGLQVLAVMLARAAISAHGTGRPDQA